MEARRDLEAWVGKPAEIISAAAADQEKRMDGHDLSEQLVKRAAKLAHVSLDLYRRAAPRSQ